ncbi:Auxin response factor [Quillaja saponaria]|uniref:Auxin response factor n=1 Tax=Quillaja saponaria TaxID=32244 RepID=A0AAD7M4K8_QUISA|nr:Auxin response factor [Quillaja saponaria]KAJ7968621.1 Auxin response factor [Quillaja saponaria]
MRFETEDAAERRCTGLITGISDVDPVSWPGSKWKCLLVRWDDAESTRHTRVSPWEIEPSTSASCSNSFSATGLKRTRIGLLSSKPEFPVPNGIGMSGLWGTFKVPEGLARNAATGDSIRIPQVNSDIFSNGTGFGESFRFQKVLQGQEIFPGAPFGRASFVNGAHEHVPFVSNCEAIYNTNTNLEMEREIQRQRSYLSEPRGKFALSPPCGPMPTGEAAGPNSFGMLNVHDQLGLSHSRVSQSAFRGSQELVTSCKNSCRLFGFSLTEEKHVANKVDNPIPIARPLNHGASFIPGVGEQLHPEPPIRSKAI